MSTILGSLRSASALKDHHLLRESHPAHVSTTLGSVLNGHSLLVDRQLAHVSAIPGNLRGDSVLKSLKVPVNRQSALVPTIIGSLRSDSVSKCPNLLAKRHSDPRHPCSSSRRKEVSLSKTVPMKQNRRREKWPNYWTKSWSFSNKWKLMTHRSWRGNKATSRREIFQSKDKIVCDRPSLQFLNQSSSRRSLKGSL